MRRPVEGAHAKISALAWDAKGARLAFGAANGDAGLLTLPATLSGGRSRNSCRSPAPTLPAAPACRPISRLFRRFAVTAWPPITALTAQNTTG